MARRYYTPDLANKSLPLVQAIARDVREVVQEMERAFRALQQQQGVAGNENENENEKDEGRGKRVAPTPDPPPDERGGAGDRSDLEDRVRELHDRFGALMAELDHLGVELKDPAQGLLDFRAKHEGRDVCLCWRLGEERVAHWHEIEAGFRGRKPIDTL